MAGLYHRGNGVRNHCNKCIRNSGWTWATSSQNSSSNWSVMIILVQFQMHFQSCVCWNYISQHQLLYYAHACTCMSFYKLMKRLKWWNFIQCFYVFLGVFASEKCQEDVIPFVCLYVFPLCSSLDQQLILPTKEECERISTTTCQMEFNLAVGTEGISHFIPYCDLLPSNNGNS